MLTNRRYPIPVVNQHSHENVRNRRFSQNSIKYKNAQTPKTNIPTRMLPVLISIRHYGYEYDEGGRGRLERPTSCYALLRTMFVTRSEHCRGTIVDAAASAVWYGMVWYG